MAEDGRPRERDLWRAGFRLIVGFIPYVLRRGRRLMAVVVGLVVALVAGGGVVGFEVLLSSTGIRDAMEVSLGLAALAAFLGAVLGVFGTVVVVNLLDTGFELSVPHGRKTIYSRALRRNPQTAGESDDQTLAYVTNTLLTSRASIPPVVVGNVVVAALGFLAVIQSYLPEGRITGGGWAWVVVAPLILVLAAITVRALGLTEWRLSILEPVARERFGPARA